jgi:hypothetical protein
MSQPGHRSGTDRTYAAYQSQPECCRSDRAILAPAETATIRVAVLAAIASHHRRRFPVGAPGQPGRISDFEPNKPSNVRSSISPLELNVQRRDSNQIRRPVSALPCSSGTFHLNASPSGRLHKFARAAHEFGDPQAGPRGGSSAESPSNRDGHVSAVQGSAEVTAIGICRFISFSINLQCIAQTVSLRVPPDN